jgi:hypothetical protein
MTQVFFKHVRDDQTLVFSTASGHEYRVTFKNGLAQTIVGHAKYCPRPRPLTAFGCDRPHGTWLFDFGALRTGYRAVFATAEHPGLIATTAVTSLDLV